jgi:hypothetical protein
MQRSVKKRAEHLRDLVALVSRSNYGQGDRLYVRPLGQNRSKSAEDVPYKFWRPASNERLKAQDASEPEACYPEV